MNLIQILTALCVAYLNANYPIKQLGNVLSPANRRKAIDFIPELEDALRAYDMGAEIDWATLSQGLKNYAVKYAQSDLPKSSFIKVLKIFATYYRNSSEGALKQIVKMTALMEDDYLQGYFQQAEIDQKAVIKELSPIVKKLGGQGYGLTLEESKEAKPANPELYAQYLSLKRQFDQAWKNAVNNYVRSTGANTAPLSEVMKYLKSKGIQHGMPSGFVGRIDALGNWYTMQEEKINGGAPSATMFPQVKMNPEYDPEKPGWVFQSIRADGTMGNYGYTESFRKNQVIEKFNNLKNFDVDKTRKGWLKYIKGYNDAAPTKESIAAVILELLYRTSNRIGSVNADPKAGGFGICTLRVAHFYPQTDGSVKFIYLGKDSVKTTAVLKRTDDAIAKRICEIVYAMAEGKRPGEPLFTYGLRNGAYKPVLPGVVNALFKLVEGGTEGVTVHKLRTAKGTSMFRAYLDNLFAKRVKMTPAQVVEAWKKGGELVGKQLNHVRRSAEGTTTVQPMTSLKNYIDVDAQVELFQRYGAPIPPALEKMMHTVELSHVRAALVQAADDPESKELKQMEGGEDPNSIDEHELQELKDLQVKQDKDERKQEDPDDDLGTQAILMDVFTDGPDVLE